MGLPEFNFAGNLMKSLHPYVYMYVHSMWIDLLCEHLGIHIAFLSLEVKVDEKYC
jgi:hypothetical protein